MDSSTTVFKGSRRAKWTFLAFAVAHTVAVSACVTIWPDFSRTYRAFAPMLLLYAIYQVAAGKDHELVMNPHGFFLRRGKRVIQGSPWDFVHHFKVSPMMRTVGWVLKTPEPDPRKPESQARNRRPVYRLLHMVAGVDRVLACRRFKGISNAKLAAELNQRLEQRIGVRAQQFMDYEAWPLATGRFLAENWVMHTLKEEDNRVRLEDALGVLSALAGYSIIASLHRLADGSRAKLQGHGLVVLGTTDGTEYYFGDLINHYLLEGPRSLYDTVCEPLMQAGLHMPDPIPLVQRIASTVGSDQFGIPDLPLEHRVRYRPVDVVKVLWPNVYQSAALGDRDPGTWTMCFLNAIRALNENSPGMIDDTVRARIVMECAFPTSHLDPDTVLVPAGQNG